MKRVITATVLSVFLVYSFNSSAQAFGGKGSKSISISLGMASYNTWFSRDNVGLGGHYSPLSGLFSVQGEFGVGKYVGIGFAVGVNVANGFGGFGGTPSPYSYKDWDDDYYYGPGGWNSAYWGFGIPINVIGNFHFLQLIADKSGKTFADKLDVYAGLAVGAGPYFAFTKSGYKKRNDVGVMLIAGPHVGIRYFPADKVGIHFEMGYGKSLFNGGVTFKM